MWLPWEAASRSTSPCTILTAVPTWWAGQSTWYLHVTVTQTQASAGLIGNIPPASGCRPCRTARSSVHGRRMTATRGAVPDVCQRLARVDGHVHRHQLAARGAAAPTTLVVLAAVAAMTIMVDNVVGEGHHILIDTGGIAEVGHDRSRGVPGAAATTA